MTSDTVPGANRALWLSTIAFTVCFAVWTIFAIISIRVQQNLGLTERHEETPRGTTAAS